PAFSTSGASTASSLRPSWRSSRCSPSSWCSRRENLRNCRSLLLARDAQALNQAVRRCQHFEAQAIFFDHLSGHRNSTGNLTYHPSNGRSLVVFWHLPLLAKQGFQALNLQISRHQPGPICLVLRRLELIVFMLVRNGAYDFLQKILNRNQS